MSRGLPILGSKVPGISDLIVNNLNGILFKPMDEVSLEKTIIKFSKKTYANRMKMGHESFKLVKKFYSDEIILNKYSKHINKK